MDFVAADQNIVVQYPNNLVPVGVIWRPQKGFEQGTVWYWSFYDFLGGLINVVS